MAIMQESTTTIKSFEGKISKELPVFYNPVMKTNRDTSILLLNALNKKQMQIADPLAGSGIRSIRFVKELNKGIIKTISVNDYDEFSLKNIKENFKLNKINVKESKQSEIEVQFHNEDANLFLLNSRGFDYIDVDPFGSPNPFLDSAVKRIARDGIIAVTATDTAPLAGTYPSACKRKYWAIPLRNEVKHEVGIRILIRKVQLIGAQFDKALIPICSYSKDHYYRVFFQAQKGKDDCDTILKQHHRVKYCKTCLTLRIEETCKHKKISAGPLWTGQLNSHNLLNIMQTNTSDVETQKLMHILAEESQHNILGLIDLHLISEQTKRQPLKTLDAIQHLQKRGFIATRTHFSPHAIKTNAKIKDLVKY